MPRLDIGTHITKLSVADKKLSVSNFNNMVEAVNTLRQLVFDDNFIISGNSVRFRSEWGDMEEDFGVKQIAGSGVTLYGGSIWVGDTEYTAVETVLVLSTDVAYLGWDFNYATKVLAITNFGSTFASDPAHIRRKLYRAIRWPCEGGGYAVKVDRRYRLAEVYPANFG